MRSISIFARLAVALVCALVFTAILGRAVFAVPAPPSPTVRGVIVVMRHGVRSPTDPNELSAYVGRTWPQWEVAPGFLTPHGAQAIALFGRAYREHYGSDGVLPFTGCPAPETVFVWADVDERTKATGAALLDGLAPKCGLTARFSDASVDPLFHAVPALGKADPNLAYASIVGDTDALVDDYAPAFARLDAVLGCKGDACRYLASLGVPKNVSEKSGLVSVEGAVGLASTAVEDLTLAYADGKPMSDFSDAPIDARTLLELSPLHTLKFALTTETPYEARVQGSNLLSHLTSTIDQIATGATERGTRVPLSAKFVAFVGHDTNLAALAGMLRLHWLLTGYQPDDTPPGSALIFEVMTPPRGGAPYVRTWFTAQTLDQMRGLVSHEPNRVPVLVSGCPAIDCPVATFDRVASGAIDPAFVGTW